MNKTEIVRTRIESNLKEGAKEVLDMLGLSFSEAIQLFLRQVYFQKCIPFDIKMPNDDLKMSIAKSRKGIDVVKAENSEDLFRKLDL